MISALNYLDWKSQSTSFDALTATTGGSMTLSGVDEPVAFLACYVPARRAARLDPLIALREM